MNTEVETARAEIQNLNGKLESAQAEIQSLRRTLDATVYVANESDNEHERDRAAWLRMMAILLDELQAARRANVRR